MWLLALDYVCFIQNHTAQASLGWRTPTEWLLGCAPDITALSCFHFWEPVCCAVEEASCPEQPNEALGRFVGIADVVGASIIFKILTEEMKIIIQSTVRTARKEGAYKNRRAENHAPTLTPKPVTANLKIGEHVEGITNSSIPDDIDHGAKRKKEIPTEEWGGCA